MGEKMTEVEYLTKISQLQQKLVETLSERDRLIRENNRLRKALRSGTDLDVEVSGSIIIKTVKPE
jgi:hypothetical protein